MSEEKKTDEKKKKKIAILIASIIAFLGLLGVLGWIGHKKGEEAGRRRTRDKGNIEDEEYRKNIILEGLTTFIVTLGCRVFQRSLPLVHTGGRGISGFL